MTGDCIEVVIDLFDILPMIPLIGIQSEEPLFEDRIGPIPKGGSEEKNLEAVREARNSIFSSPIGAHSGVIVRKIVPGVSVGAIIFAHRAPPSLRYVGSPFLGRGDEESSTSFFG